MLFQIPQTGQHGTVEEFVMKQQLIHIHYFSSLTLAQFHQRSTYSFYARSSQKRKKIDNFTVFFTLLSSARVKAAQKTLMKLSLCLCLLLSISLFPYTISQRHKHAHSPIHKHTHLSHSLWHRTYSISFAHTHTHTDRQTNTHTHTFTHTYKEKVRKNKLGMKK